MASVQAAQFDIDSLPPLFDLERQGISAVDSSVQVTAQRSLFELSSAFTFSLLVLDLVGSNVSISLLTGVLGCSIVYSVCKVAYQFFFSEVKMEEKSKLARYSIFNIVMLAGPIAVIHECGHAALSLLLFKNPGTRISIRPFEGGSTSYTVSKELSYIGSLLGKARSINLTTAGGGIASVTVASAEYIFADKIEESHSSISQFFNWQATSQLANEFLYAFTTFVSGKSTRMSNDYNYLWVHAGINPLIPMALIVGIPLICKVAHKALKDS